MSLLRVTFFGCLFASGAILLPGSSAAAENSASVLGNDDHGVAFGDIAGTHLMDVMLDRGGQLFSGGEDLLRDVHQPAAAVIGSATSMLSGFGSAALDHGDASLHESLFPAARSGTSGKSADSSILQEGSLASKAFDALHTQSFAALESTMSARTADLESVMSSSVQQLNGHLTQSAAAATTDAANAEHTVDRIMQAATSIFADGKAQRGANFLPDGLGLTAESLGNVFRHGNGIAFVDGELRSRQPQSSAPVNSPSASDEGATKPAEAATESAAQSEQQAASPPPSAETNSPSQPDATASPIEDVKATPSSPPGNAKGEPSPRRRRKDRSG